MQHYYTFVALECACPTLGPAANYSGRHKNYSSSVQMDFSELYCAKLRGLVSNAIAPIHLFHRC